MYFKEEGLEEAHVMLLVSVYHFTECCVQCNGVKCLRSSVHRAATISFLILV